MTLGTNDKKKVWAVCILGGFAVYMVYSNLLSGPSVPASPRPSANTAADLPTPATPMPGALPGAANSPRTVASSNSRSGGRTEEFQPVVHDTSPDHHLDPDTVDPTLRLDLLAKVQNVELAGGARNLFQMGTAPKPPETAQLKGPETQVTPVIGPRPPQPKVETPPPPPPPPPPIPLKFYGFTTLRADGRKTAYFLDGEDILLATEGDTLKRRYKVLKIGPNAVLMEDTESKHQQSLPLADEAQGL